MTTVGYLRCTCSSQGGATAATLLPSATCPLHGVVMTELVKTRKKLIEARRLLERLEWARVGCCHICKGLAGTHEPDCELDAFLRWVFIPKVVA